MRILLADNHANYSELLGQYLELKSVEFFQRPITATTASTLADAIAIVESSHEDNRPDLIFLDLNFEREGYLGIATVERFQKSNPHNVPVVLLTGTDAGDPTGIAILRKCITQHEILGVLLKTADTRRLCNAIRMLIEGDTFYPPELATAPPPATDASSVSRADRWGLTDREWEIAVVMCRGEKTYNMAQELGIKESWLAQRLSLIYRKLGVHSRLPAVNMVRDKLRELGVES